MSIVLHLSTVMRCISPQDHPQIALVRRLDCCHLLPWLFKELGHLRRTEWRDLLRTEKSYFTHLIWYSIVLVK